METFTMVNLKVEIYNVFRFQNYFFGEHMSARLKGACFKMKDNKLLSYISMLTPAQIEKLVSQLPRLTSLLSEQAQSCHREQTSQIP